MEQLSVGFTLEGHPTAEYNGAYHKVSEDDKGWPVLTNAAGMFCYHYDKPQARGRWFLRNQHTPDSAICSSYIKSVEGPLPVGAQTWRWRDGGRDGKWTDRSMSVTVTPPPAAASAAASADVAKARLAMEQLS